MNKYESHTGSLRWINGMKSETQNDKTVYLPEIG